MPEPRHELNPYTLQAALDDAERDLRAILTRALNEQTEVLTRFRAEIARLYQQAREAQK